MNTLAYWASSTVMKEKSFITLTPGINVIKLFSFVADDEAKESKVSSRPDWKVFPRTNPLAYLASSTVMKEKSLITLTPGVTHINIFFP